MESKGTIIERHTVEVSEGVKKLDLVNILLELDARVKNTISVLNEIKEVLAGQSAWSQEVNDRLQKIDPKIVLPGSNEFTATIDKLR